MWGDEKFNMLSHAPPNGQTLFQRLLTGSELTALPGAICAREAGLAQALKWSLRGFRKVFQEGVVLELWKADWDAGVVYVLNAIEHNPPANPNVIKGWSEHWDLVPECPLKLEIWQAWHAWMRANKPEWVPVFEESCPRPVLVDRAKVAMRAESLAKGSRKGSRKGFANGLEDGLPNRMPNQDQDQDQDQD